MKSLTILVVLAMLAYASALSIRDQQTHMEFTSNPVHQGSLPVLKKSSYSSVGEISVTYQSLEILQNGAGKVYQNHVFYCTHAKECGSPPNYPCCPCSVPVNASFRHGVPPSVDNALTCLQSRVSECVFCQHACGILNNPAFYPYSNTTDCQSSRCTSNPIFNSTDCGLA